MALSEESHQCLMITRCVLGVVFLVALAVVGGCYIENYHAYKAVKTGEFEAKLNTRSDVTTWKAVEKQLENK